MGRLGLDPDIVVDPKVAHSQTEQNYDTSYIKKYNSIVDDLISCDNTKQV